jgi:FkbM family methyltransferase
VAPVTRAYTGHLLPPALEQADIRVGIPCHIVSSAGVRVSHPMARRAIKLMRVLTFAAGWQGLRHRVAAAVEHWRVLRPLEVKTVVDVGANKGQFALVASGVFPDATIYSFEPLKEPAARFREIFGENVRLFETAVGPSDREATIYVSRRIDSSSLLPITKQSDVFPGTGLKEERVIPVAPLSKYLSLEHIKPPAMLKIDVQGYELEVLKGCDPLLVLFQFIYVECSFVELYGGQALIGDVVLYLVQRKFKLSGVYNQVEDSEGKAVQADFLFTNIGDKG